jgi:hypothetical protein
MTTIVPSDDFIRFFGGDRVGTVRTFDGKLIERTENGWELFVPVRNGLLQLPEDLDSTYRIRELAFHMVKEGADEVMVRELEQIAIVGVVDRGRLVTEKHTRCPSCNHFMIIGQVCACQREMTL